MSKVEEVARALAIADGFHPEARSNDSDSVEAWTLYIVLARAAIKALDSPSDEFLHALAERMHDARFSKSGEDYPIARNFIRAIVDAALSEEGR